MGKKVFYNEDARERVLVGAKLLYDAVSTTMGVKGRNVVITHQYGPPSVSHDGVTVAEAISIKEDESTLGYGAGADMIKSAASKMNKEVGDGTTTVTVLSYHILNEANKLIAAGHNPMDLRKGIEAASAEAQELLTKYNLDIKESKEKISHIATISAGDYDIGKLIAEVIDKVGKEGSVTVEEGEGLELEYDVVEGFEFDRGFVSPLLVTDQSRMEAVYKNIPILITDQTVSSVQELAPFLEQVVQTGKKDLLIVAENIEGEALTMLVLNKLKGNFNTIAVKAPSFGDRQRDIMQDLATFVGATIVSPERGLTTANAEASVLGYAAKVVVSADKTTIIKGRGIEEDVKSRLQHINDLIDKATNEFDRDSLKKRRAALTGKVAVIKVGGLSEMEIEEKKYRVDDAVAAAKAALAEGIVAGGGVTLLNISNELHSYSDNESERAGIELFKRVLTKPFTILLDNSGINSQEWLPIIKKSPKKGFGIDVRNPEELIDLVKAGVIDPTKVTREALKNATSIAGTTITMGALVVDIPEDKVNPVQ
ncbi:MAG TPA: chaperonin GroEL [Dongiaceae bacterium]|nr:chaperonin GroEL [Dongiaceae bacterium]